MARPRRPYNGVETIEWSDDRDLEQQVPGMMLRRQRSRWKASREAGTTDGFEWRYRTPNGLYDPLTYLLVVDAIANIEPDIELRTKNLVEWLNENYKQLRGDVITVGKVLMDIRESYEDVLGKKNGMLEQGADYKGNFYRIHHDPDTAKVYYGLREDLMRLARLEIEKRNRGERTTDMVSPLRDCPTVRTGFPGEEMA